MNQQLQTRTSTAITLRSLAESPAYQNRFRELMQARAPQFVASLVQLVNGSQQLQKCEPNSVIAAAITAAALDLPIDKNLGFAHIVPYAGQAQFQIGYKGFVQLALRTGQYRKMNAKAVNAEAFGGYDEVGDPIILWDKLDETKEEVGYVFAWQMVTGFTKCIYWTREKVTAHAARYSQAFKAKKQDSPWFTNFRGMGLKTVVKDGLSHWGIMSVSMLEAIRSDQGVRRGPDAEITYPDNDAPAPGKPLKFIAPPADDDGGLAPEPPAAPKETAPFPEHEVPGQYEVDPQKPAASPAQPPPSENPELAPLLASIAPHGITEAQLLAVAKSKGIAKKETSLAELRPVTLKNLTRIISKGDEAGAKWIEEAKATHG